MGYSIFIIDIPCGIGIGNRKMGPMSWEEFMAYGDAFPYPLVKIFHQDAPSFPGDPTGNTNQRLPSYSDWHDFCQDVGLYDLFYHHDVGLIRTHPGWFEFWQKHLKIVRNARIAYQKKWPNVSPGWHDYGDNLVSGNMARIMWLEWWMKYALEHFDHPGISNS